MQISAVVAFLVLSLTAQQLARPSLLTTNLRSDEATISASERMAMAYIHDNTPSNSVILTNQYVDDYVYLFSGITGRAIYLEIAGNTVDKQSLRVYPSDNRRQVIKDLWATSELERFCRLLTVTPATHLIEYSTHPLLVNYPACMQSIWESSNKVIPASSEKVTIWKINR